jgi:thiazole/oxazole-forming peptide maturase SagC family component
MLHDAQMRIPSRPKISEDLDRINMGDNTIQIRGAENTVLLRGGSLVRLLTDLLDGSRDIEAVVEHVYHLWEEQAGPKTITSISKKIKSRARQEIQGKIFELITNLYMNGLLEDEDDTKEAFSDEERAYYKDQLLFFSRYVDVTRSSANRYGLQLSLKKSRALVISSGLFGSSLTKRLCKSGVGDLTMISLDQAHDCSVLGSINPHISFTFLEDRLSSFEELENLFKSKAFSLVIVATYRPFPNLCQWLNTICIERKIPWTVGSIDGREAIIGPTMFPGETGCYTCYVSRQKAASSSYIEDQAYEKYLNSDDTHLNRITEMEHFSDMVSGMFFLEILKIITFFSVPVTSSNKVFRVDLLTFDNSTSRFLKLPRCSSCSKLNSYPRQSQ